MSINKKSTDHSYVIILQNGTHLRHDLDKFSYPNELLEKAIAFTEVKKPDYFGLEYTFKKPKYTGWIERRKKLSRQVKDRKIPIYFSIKFYDPCPADITCDYTRHFLYLQLRKDILNRKLVSNIETIAILSALTFQIEIGDFKDEPSFYDTVTSYTLIPAHLNLGFEVGNDLFERTLNYYKLYSGLDELEAEKLYLDKCSKLPLYGVHTYYCKDALKEEKVIGIGPRGIHLMNETLSFLNFIPWKILESIRLKENELQLKILPLNEYWKIDDTLEFPDETKITKNHVRSLYKEFPKQLIVLKTHHYKYSCNIYNLILEFVNFYNLEHSFPFIGKSSLFKSKKNNIGSIIPKTLFEMKSERIPIEQLKKRVRTKRSKTMHIKSHSHHNVMSSNNSLFYCKPDMSLIEEKPRRNTLKKKLANAVNTKGLFRTCYIEEPHNKEQRSKSVPSEFLIQRNKSKIKTEAACQNISRKQSLKLAKSFDLKESNKVNVNRNAVVEDPYKSVGKIISSSEKTFSSDMDYSNLTVEAIYKSKDKEVDVASLKQSVEEHAQKSSLAILKEKYYLQKNDFFESLSEWTEEMFSCSEHKDISKHLAEDNAVNNCKNEASSSTLETGKMLAKLITEIKKDGPPKPYTFNNGSNSTVDSRVEKWIKILHQNCDFLSSNEINRLDNFFEKFDKRIIIDDLENGKSPLKKNPFLDIKDFSFNDENERSISDYAVAKVKRRLFDNSYAEDIVH